MPNIKQFSRAEYNAQRSKDAIVHWMSLQGMKCSRCAVTDSALFIIHKNGIYSIKTDSSSLKASKDTVEEKLKDYRILCNDCGGSRGGHFKGEVVGSGYVLGEYKGKNSYGHHLWTWFCPECGLEKGPSTISHITRGLGMCGRCRMDRKNNPRWKGHQDIPGIMLSSLRAGAISRGLSWDVSNEYLWKIWEDQKFCCAYTKIYLSFGYKSESTASLDRIDSKKGYIEGNIQWVHKDINRMKSNFSADYFVDLCKKVAKSQETL